MPSDRSLAEEPYTADRRNLGRNGMDLCFRNVSFSVGSGKKTKKKILHEMSGVFRAGHLSAIMGPSGAGKTSLMNVLVGFKTNGKLEGRVEVDGVERDLKRFRKRSSFITQQDHLLPHLTVAEYFAGAAQLKLGQISAEERKSAIANVMKTFNLTEAKETRISSLSGGERKRLSVALEILHNPSFIFLDEPTSGLDSSSSLQCVKLLQEIAHSGRTVVATIHQPSSRLLGYFDHLYIVADGACIYQGPVDSLVPFLQAENLICPNYHNPADFVMDVAAEECPDVLRKLVDNVENGRLICRLSETDKTLLPIYGITPMLEDVGEETRMLVSHRKSSSSCSSRKLDTPFLTQVAVLLKRTSISIWREKMVTLLRFVLHLIVGIMMGLLYWQIGDDAALVFNNAGLLFFNMFFILFSSMMPTIITFPLEMDVIMREQLNRWYSLKAYYLAKSIVDVPIQFFFATMYLVIVYLMTGQPMDIIRFSMLLGLTIEMALVAQGIGLLIGAICDIQMAVFAGPAIVCPFVLFSGFFVNLNAIPVYMRWIADVSFIRYSFEGSMVAVYGMEREALTCSEPYCHFRFANKFLEHFDMVDSHYWWSVVALAVFFLAIRIATYFVLRFRLRHVRS